MLKQKAVVVVQHALHVWVFISKQRSKFKHGRQFESVY